MKKSRRNILFTFDYELFLGEKSGSVEKCMLEPTREILELLESFKIKSAIFFVDTLFLLKLKEFKNEKCLTDFNAVKDQLKTLLRAGHYIFPHLHPHWLDAKYDEQTNQWILSDYSKYRFHSVPEEYRMSLIQDSVKLLQEIMSETKVNHKIDGYRAGGWCIQPFTDFKQLFIDLEIKHEFSVIKEFKNISSAQYFDFTNSPTENIYNFENDVCVKDPNGRFRQYTISTIPISNFIYILNKFWTKYTWKMGFRSFGDGRGLIIKEKTELAGKSDLLGSSNAEMVSIELLNYVKLPVYKLFLKKNNYMHFISHPKMVTKHNLKCFKKFLEFLSSKYDLHTNFLELSDNSSPGII